MTDKAPWTVTHADRDQSVTIRVELSSRGETPEVNAQFLRDTIDGDHDDNWLVQQCARHRHESQAELVEALREARRELGNAQELLRGTQILVVANVGFEPVLTKIDALLTRIKGSTHD